MTTVDNPRPLQVDTGCVRQGLPPYKLLSAPARASALRVAATGIQLVLPAAGRHSTPYGKRGGLMGDVRQQRAGHLPLQHQATANGSFSILPTGATE